MCDHRGTSIQLCVRTIKVSNYDAPALKVETRSQVPVKLEQPQNFRTSNTLINMYSFSLYHVNYQTPWDLDQKLAIQLFQNKRELQLSTSEDE